MKKQILLLFPLNHFFKNSLGMFLFDGEFFVFKEVVLKFIGKKNLSSTQVNSIYYWYILQKYIGVFKFILIVTLQGFQ